MEPILQFIEGYYLWIKALHITAVICWMAGLFYLPRLFVYHMSTKNMETRETLKTMARRLYKAIMVPAMHLSVTLGAALLFRPSFKISHNTEVKVTCALLLVGFQFYLNYCRKKLAQDVDYKSEKFYRIINEVPTILLIIIIICAVVKPF